MKKVVILVVPLLLSQVAWSFGDSEDLAHRANGKFIPDMHDIENTPAQEKACDCCQKCKAAKKPTKPQPEEETDNTSGCEDCCRKCGRPVQPLPEDIPPEIINKPRQK